MLRVSTDGADCLPSGGSSDRRLACVILTISEQYKICSSILQYQAPFYLTNTIFFHIISQVLSFYLVFVLSQDFQPFYLLAIYCLYIYAAIFSVLSCLSVALE